MKRKWIKRAAAFLLAGCIAFSGGSKPDFKVYAAEGQDIPSGMKLAASTSELELYIDEATTAVAVRVKKNGDVWFSNPEGIDSDTVASAYHKDLMRSQFSIRYFNESAQSSEMDNYTDSIANGQFEITYESDGVSILYQLGELADKYILPQAISEERYLQFTEQMDKSDKKKTDRVYNYLDASSMRESEREEYIEQYPSFEDHNIYVLQSSVKDYKKEEITGYFAKVGYTAEDMAFDNEENGVLSANEKPWFNVTLEYKLDGESLIAQIDPKKVEYNTEGYYLVDIDLLEFFGAAGPEEEGYLFVPDGSGALIYLNSGKTDSAYFAPVYGRDITNTFNSKTKSEIDQAVTVRMPVYGLKTGDKAWFAIIEENAAAADITADNAGKTNSYNNVYAGFSYLSYGKISLGDVVGTQTFQMYSPAEFEGLFRVRYNFLHGEEANYTGMAHFYQSYLESQGALKKQTAGNAVPFYANLIGAIEKTKSIFGIKYNAVQELTTYAQAEKIVEELQSAGVSNLKIQYQGWAKGGLHGTAPKAASALSKLNASGVSLKKFLSDMTAKGITVFHSAQLQYVYKSALGDGYASGSHAPQYYDKSTVRTGEYLIPNGMLVKRDVDLISPYYVVKMAKDFEKKVKKYDFTGVAVNTLASELFSDYASSRYTDRSHAAGYNSEAIELLNTAVGGNVLANNANAYAFSWLSDIIEVPFDSNNSRILDETIPFYAIVLHGYKDFAGPNLNMSDDFETTVLQSIECGAGLSFEWIYGDNHLLKDTDFDSLYSINFAAWKEKAISTYEKVNAAVGSVQGQRIAKHEQLADKVYATTYENGTCVIVNYNKKAVSAAGQTVEARDFVVVKER